MKRNLFLTFFVAACFASGSAVAQRKEPQKPGEEPVRLGVTLVQIDAVVVDKDGNQVEGLTTDNFELLESGKKQKLLHCDYVKTERAPLAAVPRSNITPAERRELKAVDAGVSREEVQRVIAFIVDDIRIPAPELPRARDVLTDFVDNQMEDGDLIAVIRTNHGSGILQQFTTDRRLLRRAIDQIRMSRVGFFDDDEEDTLSRPTGAGGASAFRDSGLDESDDVLPETVTAHRTASGLESINYLIGGMRQLPGRKAVVLLSPGFATFGVRNADGASPRMASALAIDQALQALTFAATQAGVVIHTVDIFGLRAFATSFYTAGVGASGAENPQFGRTPEASQANLVGMEGVRQSGLRRLANESGGTVVINTNDIKSGVQRISRDLKGYYLLSYSPDEVKLDDRFHRIEVRVKGRGGVRVRTREGYVASSRGGELGFGTSISTSPPPAADRVQELLQKMMSPLVARAVRVQPSLYMGKDAAGTMFVHALLYVPGEDVRFHQEASGRVSSLDVAGFFFDEYGNVVDHFARRLESNWTPENYQDASERGIVISNRSTLPHGFYQFRAVVRDNLSGKFGSFSQSLMVPDPSGSDFQVSLPVLSADSLRAITDHSRAAREAELMLTRRKFPRSGSIAFVSQVFGAQRDKKSGLPALQQQITVFKETTKDYEGPPTPVTQPSQAGAQTAFAGGTLNLSNFTAGRYILKFKVIDTLGKKGRNSAVQYLTFSVY